MNISDLKPYINLFSSMLHRFAEVEVTSNESLKILFKKIPKCELNGERIDCRLATSQNLGVFEDMANRRKNSMV